MAWSLYPLLEHWQNIISVQHCHKISGTGKKINSGMEYFTIARPKSGDAKGLFECLQVQLQEFGIASSNVENWKMLAGIATNRASINIATTGPKGLAEKELQWMWCLVHRQELALKIL